MSWQAVPEGLGDEDHQFLKVYKVIVTSIRTVFLFLFSEACPKHPSQSLKSYLQSPPLNMSGGDFRKNFNASQRITLDADPTGKEFDISLLFVSIQTSCQKLAPRGDSTWSQASTPPGLEYLLTTNKNFRNNLFHENQQMDMNFVQKWVQEVEELVEKTYLAIGIRYTIDVTNEISKMKDNIVNIMNASIPVPDIIHYRQDIKILREGLKIDFKTKGQEELKTTSDILTMTDPASFISGRETLKVTLIYTRIDLVEELNGKKNDIPVQYENLLAVLGWNGKLPHILILEGPAGSGKTTLTKLVLAEWVNCLQGFPYSFIDLNKFDFIFPYECSNSDLSSYLDLITYLLPKTSLCLRNDDILRSARQLKILILVDAADDLNPKSKILLKELLETLVPESGGNLRIIWTTRPQALEDVMSMIPAKLTTVHTKITGISPNRREEFVTRLHEGMISEKQSTQETKGLVNYLNRSHGNMGDHFRFPLVLTLLTYLWAADPEAVNGVTTVSKLYLAIHILIQKRLFDRLSKHEKIKDVKNSSEIKECSCKFLNVLYQESLVSIGMDAMILPNRCTCNLKKAADLQGLPQAEVFAGFLSLERKWTAYGYINQLAGSHKSLLEFYGAYYIVDVITGNVRSDQQLDLENKLAAGGLKKSEKKRIQKELTECKTVYGVLKNIHKEILTPLVMSKYQNLLVHLMGLLTIQGEIVLHRFHEEVIELMKESGAKGSYWFQAVSEAECDSFVTKAVAMKMKRKDKEMWHLSDNNMGAALEMLKTVSPRNVRLILETDPSTLQFFPILCTKLAESTCKVSLEDIYSWKNPTKCATDSYFSLICNSSSSCYVIGLFGNFELSTSISVELDLLDTLALAISDDQQAASHHPTLTHTFDILSKKKLMNLALHIGKSVSAPSLPKMNFDWNTISSGFRFSLVMPYVEDGDVQWTVDVIETFWPRNPNSKNRNISSRLIMNIGFPASCLSRLGCEHLLKKLSERSISGLTLLLYSPNITKAEMQGLDTAENRIILEVFELRTWFYGTS